MASPPIVLPRALLYGPQRYSPRLPQAGFVLTFTAAPAEGPDGAPTVALFAAGRLPGRSAQIYGGRIQGAAEIVAIATGTGRVFHNRAERDDAVPLPLVMKPVPAPPEPGEAEIESMEAYFAVDLRAQLALPPEAAAYTVFLWLDEMTSGALATPLAGAEGVPVVRPAIPPPPGLRFRRSGSTPRHPAAGIVLQRAAGEDRVYGAADPALLSPPPAEGAQDHLTILGLDFRSRQLQAHSFPVPEATRTNQDLSFEFQPNMLFMGPGWMDPEAPPRRGFLLACLRQALSPVLVIED